MIYRVKLYIFADIRLLIFIIAFKNRAVKIKNMAAAVLCCGSLLCYNAVRVKLFYLPVLFWGVTQAKKMSCCILCNSPVSIGVLFSSYYKLMQHAEPLPYPIGGQQRGIGG